MINLRVGRVDVFLHHSLCARVEQTSAKAHHLSADAYPGEDDASGIAVDKLATVVLIADACLEYEFLLVAIAQGGGGKRTAVLKVVAKLELLYYVVAEATASEILHSYSHAIGVVVQDVLEIACCPFVDNEHALALALLTLFVVGELTLLYLDMVFLGKPAQCLRIGHLLMLHDEAYGIASLATSKAMTHATSRRHIERRRLLVVKRAQTLIVCTTASQRHKLRHYLHYIGSVFYPFYCCVVDHYLLLH